MMVENSERTLDTFMARLAQGDRSAFNVIFERLWPPTLSFCANILKNDADAADAAQQAMEKILVQASNYDPQRPALPWALAIASWECRTILRKYARRREAPYDLVPEPMPSKTDDMHIQRQLIEAALVTMRTLSGMDQETLVATFWEEEANVSGATLRKRRERAIVRLRNAFRRLYGID